MEIKNKLKHVPHIELMSRHSLETYVIVTMTTKNGRADMILNKDDNISKVQLIRELAG